MGTGRARTRVVLMSRVIKSNSILMMKNKWKWLIGKIYLFHPKEVASQGKNAAHLALVAYNTCSMALSPNLTRTKEFGSINRLY